MNEQFERAELNESCLVPQSKADARWLQHAVRRGCVIRPAQGIYARREYWNKLAVPQRTLHIMKGLSQLHPNWVFAGCSAAVAHGLDVGYGELDRICLATDSVAHASNGPIGQRIIVSHDSPVERQGIKVTSFARTVGDCMRTLNFASALAIADSALRIKEISPDRLELNVRAACAHHPGLDRVTSIIRLADGRAENGGESKVRAHMIRLGFATPSLQRLMGDPLDADNGYRVDFAWDLPDGSLVLGELDGKDKYVDPSMTGGKSIEDVILDERRREAHITLSNRPIRVMRFSYAEACDDAYFSRLLASYGVPRTMSVPLVAFT